jgi:hypothetical protein
MIPASPWLLIHSPADGAADPVAGGPVVARFHGDLVRRLFAFADSLAEGAEGEADALLFGGLVQGNGIVISVEGLESAPLRARQDPPEPLIAQPEGISSLLKLTLAISGLHLYPQAVGFVRSKAGSRLVADSEDRRRYRMHCAGGPGVLLLVRRHSATTIETACYFGDVGDLPLSVAARFSLFSVENPLPAVFVGISDRELIDEGVI